MHSHDRSSFFLLSPVPSKLSEMAFTQVVRVSLRCKDLAPPHWANKTRYIVLILIIRRWPRERCRIWIYEFFKIRNQFLFMRILCVHHVYFVTFVSTIGCASWIFTKATITQSRIGQAMQIFVIQSWRVVYNSTEYLSNIAES